MVNASGFGKGDSRQSGDRTPRLEKPAPSPKIFVNCRRNARAYHISANAPNGRARRKPPCEIHRPDAPAGGRWRVAGGRWQVAGGGWQVAGSGWRANDSPIHAQPPVHFRI
jgi:hypothetical protein